MENYLISEAIGDIGYSRKCVRGTDALSEGL